jgi:predicted SnoaL-like aldol condensation-catalyzing enzyme
LTPEVQAKIVEAMSVGNYFHVCCEYAGVTRTTGFNWLARARDARAQAEEHNQPIPLSEQPFVEFLDAVTRARAQAEIRLVSSVAAAALQDKEWRAAVEILKRGFRDNWREDTIVQHQGTVDIRADESLAHLEEVAKLLTDSSLNGDQPA